MPKISKKDTTRERIQTIATRLFAENGFDNTSTRMLTAEAACNLGAVNYYYGSKQKLYEVVIASVFGSLAERLRGLSERAVDAASWEDALRVWINQFLSLVMSQAEPEKWVAPLLSRELASPSRISEQLFHGFFVPLFHELRQLIIMALPPAHTYDEEQHVVISVVAQCVFMANARPPWDGIIIPATTPREQWIREYGEYILQTITSRLEYKPARDARRRRRDEGKP